MRLAMKSLLYGLSPLLVFSLFVVPLAICGCSKPDPAEAAVTKARLKSAEASWDWVSHGDQNAHVRRVEDPETGKILGWWWVRVPDDDAPDVREGISAQWIPNGPPNGR